ncbi:hypothetical protein Taro_036327 [Colocasia esculenta]|uniref:Uncharacterized protein n=1 Tax=Colocasia esculenta TaxID=4460 RepID=A0A843WD22_COLES|nr:hypothetical protein [Colocasia esculenta]
MDSRLGESFIQDICLPCLEAVTQSQSRSRMDTLALLSYMYISLGLIVFISSMQIAGNNNKLHRWCDGTPRPSPLNQ